MHLCIAGLTFVSKKYAKKHIRYLLGSLIGCEVLQSSPNYKILFDLWTRSMQYVPNVKSFVVIRKFSGASIRSITHERIIDWSVSAAISGKSAGHWTMLTGAFRSSIRPQIREFKTKIVSKCAICDCSGFLECDHVSRFRDLMREFLSQRADVPTDFDYDLSGWKFKLVDLQFEAQWLEFHEAHAQLRLLCPSCHLKHSNGQRFETSDNFGVGPK